MEDDDTASLTNTMSIIEQFKGLYGNQLQKVDSTTYDGLKMKTNILESYVKDLTDQNTYLLQAVEELESESLKRLNALEANLLSKSESHKTSTSQLELGQADAIGSLRKELCKKDQLVEKYRQQIEELKESFGRSCKQHSHHYSMCDQEFERSSIEQPPTGVELESTQAQVCQLEKEVNQLKKKLKETECSGKRLICDLTACEKNAREMRAALTSEVAEKHDQILALRREVSQLEEQLRQADMQTHFKDDIIKELRKEVKVARSKETLVEVLGIKERSLSRMEQLTEQLQSQDQTIRCLRAELQRRGSSSEADRMFRIKQQVEWVLDNISQQCAQANVSDEFTKCITTMLEELRESVECCNFGPGSPTEPCKDSAEFIAALQQSLDQSQDELSQSWASIWETAHQLNKIELSTLVDQWRVCLNKHQSLQELFRSIVELVCSPKSQVGNITKSVDGLYTILENLSNELNCQIQMNGVNSWLRKIQRLITESITKIQDISNTSAEMRCKQEELICKLESLAEREVELRELSLSEQRAYDNLYNMEKSQKVKVDTLLTTVLHHQELWCQHKDLGRDMSTRINYIITNLKQSARRNERQPTATARPAEQVKCLVSKISADLKNSLCDIAQRQIQVNELEVELSEVRVILEAAQLEIQKITKGSNFKELDRKLMCLLNKLKKEIKNAITKAGGLVEIYKASSSDYLSSTERLHKIQKDVDSLEEEIQNICNDFNASIPKVCEDRVCSSNAQLQLYKNRCQEHILTDQYKQMKKVLLEKDMALKNVRNNITELRTNVHDRERLTDTQDETIKVLQNSLKLCQKEVGELHKKLLCTESNKSDSEKDYKKQIQGFQNKISNLQDCLKQSEEATVAKDGESVRNLQNANLELATLAGYLQEDCRRARDQLIATYQRRTDDEKKHQRSEAAFQLVICNLKEGLAKKENEVAAHLKGKKDLESQLTSMSKGYQAEREINCKKDLEANQSRLQACELEKEVQHWKNQFIEVDAQMKEIREEIEHFNQHEKEIKQEMSNKEAKLKEELSEKQIEVCKLSGVIKSMSEKLKEASGNLETERVKICESDKRLQSVCAAYEEVKIKAAEKEATAEKLQSALTQLSSKLVSRRLDGVSLNCLKHFQEECAKFEALYNATACKLHSKEVEMAAVMREIERLKNEVDIYNKTSLPVEQQEDACPFLLGRVQQLSRELQVAHSCRLNCEAMLKELTDTCSNKDEEIARLKEENVLLKSQVKQVTLQRDKLLLDLDKAQSEIVKLKMDNSDLHSDFKILEQAKPKNAEQINKPRTCEAQCNCQGKDANVEVQREISNALTSQLRGVKQKLHATRHDYKKLQTAYEELSGKYNKLHTRAEKDDDFHRPVCHPCTAKPSKSLAHLKYPDESQEHLTAMKYSQSKSWHKMDTEQHLRQREKKWKEKLQDIMRSEDFDVSELMQRSSSSN